jgi:oligoribonuclease NrnB/cAMP/cGMP phosphodiesterase (DHH superfamily)
MNTLLARTQKVFFGHTDLDGVSAIALGLKALNPKEYKIKLHDPSLPFPKLIAYEVFIFDIAVTPQTWGSIQNISAKKILWIDHHKPGVEVQNLPPNLELVLDPSAPSAVGLVKKYFGLDDEFSAKISDIGTKADTWRLEPEVVDWMDVTNGALYYHENIEKVISALENLNINEVQDILQKYRAEKEEAKKELLKHTNVQEIHGHSVAIGLVPKILSGSESADIILQKTGSEIQIVLKEEGWMSFRRAKNSTVNLLDLAKLFGGGGHEYASGADTKSIFRTY